MSPYAARAFVSLASLGQETAQDTVPLERWRLSLDVGTERNAYRVCV